MSEGFIESSAGASSGGFQGIEGVRGLLVDIVGPVDPPYNSTKQVLKVTLAEASVTSMFEGEEEFELTDGKFEFLVPYAEKGKTPHKNSIYIKCWVASAEELSEKLTGKKSGPSSFKGQYVNLKKQVRKLFDQNKIDPETKKPVLGADGKAIKIPVMSQNEQGRPTCFCFTTEEGEVDVKGYVKSKLVGLTKEAALRLMLTDSKCKPFKDELKASPEGFAEGLGLKVVEGKFVEVS